MTRIVLPEEFNATFLAVARRRKAAIEAAWDDRLQKYTRLFLDDEDGLLAAVSRRLGLQYCGQYFGLDAMLCEKVDAKTFSPDKWWVAEQLTVVIEHEHVIWASEKEMNKLTIYNSPLKVLITYPPSDKVASRRLLIYADILRRGDVFNDFPTKRRHLVIFGFKPDLRVRWESYVYRLGKFVPLEVKP